MGLEPAYPDLEHRDMHVVVMVRGDAAAVLHRDPAGRRHPDVPDSLRVDDVHDPEPGGVRLGPRRSEAATDLYGTAVTLSVSGLPSGVTASFSPSTATIGGRSVLTLTAAPSSAAGAFTATVTAMTLSSDPIGTTTPLGLTISAP